MKKKAIIIVASAFVAVAVAALVIFVLLGNPKDAVKEISLEGNWKIAAYFSNGTPTLPAKEYIAFTSTEATAYKDGAVIATSPYTFENGTALNLPNMSRSYTVERRTDNYIRLYQSPTVYLELIRYPDNEFGDNTADKTKLPGKWNVVFRNADNPAASEVIEFTENELKDYQNGASEPSIATPYFWSADDCLTAEKMNIEFRLIQLSESKIFFIETKSGLIWELERAE